MQITCQLQKNSCFHQLDCESPNEPARCRPIDKIVAVILCCRGSCYCASKCLAKTGNIEDYYAFTRSSKSVLVPVVGIGIGISIDIIRWDQIVVAM